MATLPEQEITVFPDVPLYNERVTLDGQEYILEFDYSEREDRWYLSIQDITGNPLATGIKLIANWPLLRQRVDPRLPPGDLYVYDPIERDAPQFADMGRSVSLRYRPRVTSG